MTRAVVGLTASADRPPEYYDPYVAALSAAGAEVVRLLAGEPFSLEGLTGLCIPGGADIEPARYGAERAPLCGEPEVALDELELTAVPEAVASGVPVLGICRGLQVVNVALGGTLVQHVDGHQFRPPAHPRDFLAHEVRVQPGTRLGDLLRPDPRVNSRHHQAADRVAPSLRVAAWSHDEVVEALESDDGRVIAVQAHPENLGRPEWARELFARFVRSQPLRSRAWTHS